MQQTQTANSLKPEEKDEIEQLVNKLWGLFENKSFARYDEMEWSRIAEEWSAHLYEATIQTLPVTGYERIVQVLNAAWLARIRHPDRTNSMQMLRSLSSRKLSKNDF